MRTKLHFKNLALLFVALCIGFSACKKDDDQADAKAKIIGKWYFKSEVEREYQNGVLKDTDTYTDFGNDEYLEFKSDGTVRSSDDGSEPEVYNYTISSDGKTLTVKFPGDDDETMEIAELTSTKLVIIGEYSETEEGINYRWVFEQILER